MSAPIAPFCTWWLWTKEEDFRLDQAQIQWLSELGAGLDAEVFPM